MSRADRPVTAQPKEWETALTLLFNDLPATERRDRVANALRLIQSGELNPEGVFVLHSRRELEGAIVCLPVPGASALIWPPRVRVGADQQRKEDELVRHAVAWLRQSNIKLAQCLLTPEECHLAPPLERNGFNHITHLWYLKYDFASQRSRSAPSGRLAFCPYSAANRDRFHQTLVSTFADTLDCPEVNGVRTIDEIIAGHRSQGRVPAEAWSLVSRDGTPVGVLILVEQMDSGDWEIAYLGVTPEARRQGVGRELVFHALQQALTAGAARVTLSVDGRNKPAWDLYRQLNFQPTDRREVYLASWH